MLIYEDVILVRPRRKDWWLILRGKIIGPRPELIKEFSDIVNARFHMYQADRFIELAAKHFQHDLKPDIVNEIKDVRTYATQSLNEREMLQDESAVRNLRRQERLIRIRALKSEIDALKNKQIELEHRKVQLTESLTQVTSKQLENMEYYKLINELGLINNELEELKYRRDAIEEEYKYFENLKMLNIPINFKISH